MFCQSRYIGSVVVCEQRRIVSLHQDPHPSDESKGPSSSAPVGQSETGNVLRDNAPRPSDRPASESPAPKSNASLACLPVFLTFGQIARPNPPVRKSSPSDSHSIKSLLRYARTCSPTMLVVPQSDVVRIGRLARIVWIRLSPGQVVVIVRPERDVRIANPTGLDVERSVMRLQSRANRFGVHDGAGFAIRLSPERKLLGENAWIRGRFVPGSSETALCATSASSFAGILMTLRS